MRIPSSLLYIMNKKMLSFSKKEKVKFAFFCRFIHFCSRFYETIFFLFKTNLKNKMKITLYKSIFYLKLFLELMNGILRQFEKLF